MKEVESSGRGMERGAWHLDGWSKNMQCPLQAAVGNVEILEGELQWVSDALAHLQIDGATRWVKMTAKNHNRRCYSRKISDGSIILRRWTCNANKSCICKAELMLVREVCGALSMYERGNHGHDELPLITSSKKRGLPINIKAELIKYVKSDMLVLQIVHQMELGGFEFNGVKKKQVRDFLVYQRQVHGLQGSSGKSRGSWKAIYSMKDKAMEITKLSLSSTNWQRILRMQRSTKDSK